MMTKCARPASLSLSVRNLIAASLTGAALVAATPEPAAAQTTLDLETARDLVPTLVAVGQPAAAREMALALLARDPTNVPLLLALSRAENDLGNPEAAITAARAAFVASTTHRERYSASLLMAQALAANDQKFLAGIWLRRAADEATTEAERARAVRDYHVVSGQSALGVNH